MNIFVLVWNYLKSKPLGTSLNVVLLAIGVSVITLIILFNNQLEERISSNVKGIDLVVGAKGSPMQLILCNIFHVDFPTGNINLAEAERVSKGRLVKTAIPLALGDSYNGYRIVGTTHGYTDLYEASVSNGSLWSNDMEVTLGANAASELKLSIGDEFESTHGLTTVGHAHDERHFKVAGILSQTGTIIDELILTSVESVWLVHDEGDIEQSLPIDDSTTTYSPLLPDHPANDSTREITSLLILYRSPMAAIQLPRIVNSQTTLQAASPAFETARLFTILGFGVEVLSGFAYVLIFISALSIFIALYNSLKERRYDIAIMRSMGASRLKVMVTLQLEGIYLTLLGGVLGILAGHLTLSLVAVYLDGARKAGMTGFVFYNMEWWVLGGGMVLGLLCAALPSVQAYRTDISKTLASN